MVFQRKDKSIDMCNGPLVSNIIRYTIPIILTGVFQMFFNAADIIVIGQFCGSLSVGAIGATSSIINLMLNLFIGISTGVGAVVATNLGAQNKEAVFRTVHTAIPLALICGVFVSVMCFTFSKYILILMKTPEDILGLSTLYLKIYSIGMLFSLVYNFSAAILRAKGDTKSPLIYLTISGIVNVVLNIIFVKVFSMNVEGVAIATVVSQILSAVLVIIRLLRIDGSCKLYLSKLYLYLPELKRIISIGIPAGIQGTIFSFSNVIIQSSINTFGASAVTGNSAAGNIEGFIYVVMNSFYQTALNFTGQNVGAGKYERLNKILKYNLMIMTGIALSIISLILIFSRQLLNVYITNDSASVDFGITRMQYVCSLYFLCGIMEIFTGMLRGLGSSVAPMFISILGACGFRILWIFTIFQIPILHNLNTLYIAYPISWSLCIIAELILYIFLKRKHTKKEKTMYPLLLKATVKDYIWGGKKLIYEFGFESDGDKAAEAWLLSCHKDGENTVLNGEYSGKTLSDVLSLWDKKALGKNASSFTYFPILIKLIDAKDRLSLQVHPDDEYALKNENEYGKTEMWYVVDCEENSNLIYGLNKEISKEEFRQRIENNTIEEVCNKVSVKKGDVFFIESGTLHAIGSGILIAEVQQNSNSTYRVSDYGRLGADGKPRQLHIDKAIDVTTREPVKVKDNSALTVKKTDLGELRNLASCELFTVDLLDVNGEISLFERETFISVVLLEGSLKFEGNNVGGEMKKGSSLFIPAAVTTKLIGKAKVLLSKI